MCYGHAMSWSVIVRVNEREVFTLLPGDVLGRLWRAALRLDDPTLSEVHAVVDLRDGELTLSCLRDSMLSGGRSQTEVVLSRGVQIELSPHTSLEVVEVCSPIDSIALELPHGERRRLEGPVSIVGGSRLALERGVVPRAALVLYSDGKTWFARKPSGAKFEVVAGRQLMVGDVAIPVVQGGEEDFPPSRIKAAVASPLRIVVRYETVHIHRDLRETVVIDGLGARIISELGIAGVPVGWKVVATDLWKNESDVALLRRKWDAVVVRIRRKLRSAGIRGDLIRADRHGNFELFLGRGDQVEDQS